MFTMIALDGLVSYVQPERVAIAHIFGMQIFARRQWIKRFNHITLKSSVGLSRLVNNIMTKYVPCQFIAFKAKYYNEMTRIIDFP